MRYKVPRPKKLTSENVTIMRSLRVYNPHIFTCYKLASWFDVGHTSAWMAITNRTWKIIDFPSDEDAHIIAKGYLYNRLYS